MLLLLHPDLQDEEATTTITKNISHCYTGYPDPDPEYMLIQEDKRNLKTLINNS